MRPDNDGLTPAQLQTARSAARPFFSVLRDQPGYMTIWHSDAEATGTSISIVAAVLRKLHRALYPAADQPVTARRAFVRDGDPGRWFSDPDTAEQARRTAWIQENQGEDEPIWRTYQRWHEHQGQLRREKFRREMRGITLDRSAARLVRGRQA